jgi:hypothetical protein
MTRNLVMLAVRRGCHHGSQPLNYAYCTEKIVDQPPNRYSAHIVVVI